jgi:putative N-acetylmannosamine-6-phosphate epimerase
MDIINNIKSKLIVSCQPVVGGVLDNERSILALAEASVNGGATALRINDKKNVYNVKKKLNVPIIGIKKRKVKNSNVVITPFCEDINSLADSGADIIAFDATIRKRPVEIEKLIELIHKKNCISMADCSNYNEAVNASFLGADIVASTLSGYIKGNIPKNPDFRIISKFSQNNINKPIIAEGRINTPKQAAQAIKMGAHAVVVGTAINRIEIITDWFAAEIVK